MSKLNYASLTQILDLTHNLILGIIVYEEINYKKYIPIYIAMFPYQLKWEKT